MHDPRRSRRSVARDPIVHGLSKREKKKKQAKCREFVECLQSTTAPGTHLPARLPPSYPVECDCPPKPPDGAARMGLTQRAYRFASLVDDRRSTLAIGVDIHSRASHGDRFPPFVECLRAQRRRPATTPPIACDAQPPTVVAFDDRLAVPLAFIRVQPHSDTMHPLTSALAKSRPQFDSRPQACVHPSVLPPPVAPPLVCAAPPPPAARAG
ncbi:hypothetical protein [Burkholderia cenocepacia]|uniref:hypothetical protein n=1 Tax=Burkholderia cenocepacia TaxID=95486 RepID=UPI002AAF9990|nr:hypothetical protein [Burkholderia cenocepacia]